jgi:hypothetical protein
MLHPWMLLGLLGLGVPVILHLIQRQRLRPQVLATLEFLDVENAANAFAPVPRDWLQLLLRLLLLGLFVLLMARLAIQGDTPGPRTVAVLLDQSLSMQRKADPQHSLFDRCQKQILELIERMGPEDRVALFLVGDRVVQATGFLQDKEPLRQAATAFRVSDGGGRAIMPTLWSVVRQLAVGRDANSCVLLFSDHQRSGFQSYLDEAGRAADGNPTLAFREELDRGHVQLVLIDGGSSESENLALENARFTPEQVYLGSSSRVTATVHNYSDKPRTANVHVVVGQQASKPRELPLGPGETAQVDLVGRFESPEDAACRVEIDPDVLPADDRYYLPMRIRDRTQVLLVTPPGDAQTQPAGLELSHRGGDLLAYAMNPGETLGQGTGTAVNVKRITPALLGRVSLPMYAVVVLYGVADLPETSLRDLLTYVRNGGGVWLIPDGDVSPLRFNEGYGKLLSGLAIGQLKRPERAETLSRDETAIGTPVWLPLLEQQWGDSRDVYFSRYHALQSPGTAAVALRTAGGDPLAALIPLGRGRVFVQLLDNELESSSLPRTSLLVPMVQQAIALLSRRGEQAAPDVMRVGEVRRMSLPELRGLRGEVDVKGPQPLRLPLSGAEGGEVRVEGLSRAGMYRVSHPAKPSSRTHYLAVNPVLEESNLTPLSNDEQAALFGTENVTRLAAETLDARFVRRREIVPWLAIPLCLVMVVESLAGAWQARRKLGKESPQ